MTISNNLLTDIYQAGHCFTFTEKIADFGLVFLEVKISAQATHYYFFPVRLDTSREGLGQFIHGDVYLSYFLDYTMPSGITQGFMCFSCYNRKSVKSMNTYLSPVGRLVIQANYLNATGFTGASGIDEFANWLEQWEAAFGRNAKLVNIRTLLE
jgi:hypothetical protein